jgi:pSer/pThr/pTyr-binding forkhead associated (FHA) protein
MALLKITDASGRQSQHNLAPKTTCLIGRAPDNQVVLDDPRASRHHAHVKTNEDGSFVIVDGVYVNGQIHRSANKVYINGEQKFEHPLKNGDRITIGASTLRFEQAREERTADLSYDDKPLGHTQLLMSAKDVLSTVLRQQAEAAPAVAGAPRDKVLEQLQRKANILAELYEMSKALGSGFDLDKIFKKATDIIFR